VVLFPFTPLELASPTVFTVLALPLTLLGYPCDLIEDIRSFSPDAIDRVDFLRFLRLGRQQNINVFFNYGSTS
jgi:hypothetical protein